MLKKVLTELPVAVQIDSVSETLFENERAEEELGVEIRDANEETDRLLQAERRHDTSVARRLLIRLCELEERLLCREVEMQQLTLD